MAKTMQEVFPALQNRESVLIEIQSKKDLKQIFESWEV